MSEVDEELAVETVKQTSKAPSHLNADDYLLLSKLKRALSETPELDLEKISAIKQEIANGDYSISSLNLAKKILEVET